MQSSRLKRILCKLRLCFEKPENARSCRRIAVQSVFLLAAAPTVGTAVELDLVASDAIKRVVASYPSLQITVPRELPMKLRSLLQDPYTYFRGSAVEFDLWFREHCGDWMADQRVRILLHGDVHIGNVGTFVADAGKGDETIRCGLVDFDEVFEGPFQFDLLRALASVRVGASSLGLLFSEEIMAQQAAAMVANYKNCLAGETSYEQIVKESSHIAGLLVKAKKNDLRKYFERYSSLGDRPTFRNARIKDGLIKDVMEKLDTATRAEIITALWNYVAQGSSEIRAKFGSKNLEEFDQVVFDAVRWTRIGSSGSQGVHKFLLLVQPTAGNDSLPMILELKQEPVPAASRAGIGATGEAGERASQVVSAHPRLCKIPPRLVGHTRIGDRVFLVRPKEARAEEFDIEDFNLKKNPSAGVTLSSLLGAVIGLSHRQAFDEDANRIQIILDQLQGLEPILVSRSKQVSDHMLMQFDALSADAEARALVDAANKFIESAARENK